MSVPLTQVKGRLPPPTWVMPVSVGLLLFILAASLISEGFCFACAEKGVTWGPFALVPLALAYGRGFALEVGAHGVTVADTFFGWRWRVRRAPSARIMKLPLGHDPRFGAALTLEGRPERTVLLGDHRTVTRWLGAVEEALCRIPKAQPTALTSPPG